MKSLLALEKELCAFGLKIKPNRRRKLTFKLKWL